MNRLNSYKILMAMAVMIFVAMLMPNVSSADLSVSGGIATQNFSILANYGDWRPQPRFGTVWVPAVEPGWRPFLYGEWVYADEGLTWDSYLPYGWLTEHYGNWYYDPELGWVWVPGDQYAAAPVDWVNYDQYIGWAPLPPPGIPPYDFFGPQAGIVFNVVSINDFDRQDLYHAVVTRPPAPTNRAAIRRQAPTVEMVERATNHKIAREHLTREQTTMGDKKFEKVVPSDGMMHRSQASRSEVEQKIKKHPMQAHKPQHPGA